MTSNGSALILPGGQFRRPLLTAFFFIFSSLLILYSVSLGHNFLFDEENIILHNRFIQHGSLLSEIFRHGYFPLEGTSSELWHIYYRPLTSLTFAVDYFFWKANPFGYNLTNVLLHGWIGMLFFIFLRKMLNHDLATLLSVLLYTVHTIHTEAVTYIASRGDLLGAIFILLTLLAFRNRHLKRALVFYGLGLFCKESVLLTPAYLLILEMSFTKTRPRVSSRGTSAEAVDGLVAARPKEILKRLAPFAATAVLFLVFRKYVSPVPLGPPTNDWHEASLRFLSMGPPFLSYLEALVAPAAFKFCLAVDFVKRFSDPKVFLTLFIIFLLLTGWFVALRRRGAAFFGLSFFLVSLLPSLQIVHFQPEWAEHYLHLPAIGLAVLFGSLAKTILQSRKRTAVFMLLAAYIPFILFVGYRTWQRNRIYNDTDLFYERLSNSESPYAGFGHGYRARVAIEDQRWEDAIVPLKTANAINPNQEIFYDWLGLYYFQKNSFPEALQNFREAYTHCTFHNSRHLVKVAMTLSQMGDYEGAAKTYEFIQREHPEEVDLYTNLLMMYEFLGEPEKVKQWVGRGLQHVSANDSDTVLLKMVYARFAYRQGWDEIVKAQTEDVLEKYPNEFWYGDVAKLLAGKMRKEEFEALQRFKYPGSGFESSARLYTLMALVLNEEWQELRDYLERYGKTIEATVKEERLFIREWDRAKRAVATHP